MTTESGQTISKNTPPDIQKLKTTNFWMPFYYFEFDSKFEYFLCILWDICGHAAARGKTEGASKNRTTCSKSSQWELPQGEKGPRNIREFVQGFRRKMHREFLKAGKILNFVFLWNFREFSVFWSRKIPQANESECLLFLRTRVIESMRR